MQTNQRGKRWILAALMFTIMLAAMDTTIVSTAIPQIVGDLGGFAAGFVLASSSLTWPLASSLSGRLYLTIGFRNTALIGISIVIIGSILFHLLPFEGSPWLYVGDQLLLTAISKNKSVLQI